MNFPTSQIRLYRYLITLKFHTSILIFVCLCQFGFCFQVFNVRLGNLDIVENLDIFGKVGRAVAHDEIIPFRVKNKKLIVNGRKDDIEESSVSLTLVKVV